jgi:hypothetical protein
MQRWMLHLMITNYLKALLFDIQDRKFNRSVFKQVTILTPSCEIWSRFKHWCGFNIVWSGQSHIESTQCAIAFNQTWQWMKVNFCSNHCNFEVSHKLLLWLCHIISYHFHPNETKKKSFWFLILPYALENVISSRAFVMMKLFPP